MAPTKVKEDTQWNTSWWDFFSLAEHSARPVEWSNSSVIFSAHPTQPIITARHFSSSKQFSLPSPTLVLTSPSSYLPPTVISASPDDEWLFAYYPGNSSDGISCIWKRGASIDAWSVQEWWSLAPSAGIVAAAWLGAQREWSSVQSGASVRLEPRGPRTPVSNPTLALVTQNLQFTLCYFRFYVPSLKMMSVSLLHADAIDEGKPNSPYDPVVDGNTIKVCLNAAIGLAYNESSILIATRSQIFPTPSAPPNPQFNPIDLSMSLDMAQPQPDLDAPTGNSCGEEPTLDLCEIQLRFDLASMRLSSLPLSSIRHKSPKLTNLTFLISPPPPQTKHGSIYLAASFLDFGDFSAIPKSDLVLYSLFKTDSQDSSRSSWKCKQEATRRFTDQVLSFVVPSKPSSECSVFIGLMNTSGDLHRATSKSKQVPVGSISVLKIPDLSDSEAWEPSQIFSTREKAGREAALSAAMSPNEALLCTASSSLWSSQTYIHSLPRRRTSNGETVHPPLAVALARAVTLRKTTADLTHTLARPSMSLSHAIDVLYHTYTILELQENGLSGSLMLEAIGLTMEIFKTSAGHASKEAGKLADRWHAAHDMCSLAALNDAFNSCREGEGYDLNAVWQLVGISTWTVHFVESLLKECVLSYDLEKPVVKMEEPSTPIPIQGLQDLDSPILLHLMHPAALKNLRTAVGHVCRFRNFLKSLTERGENAQIAKDVLMELVDSSGVDFGVFEKLLTKFTEAIKPISADDLRRTLASCQPTPAVQGYLRNALQLMSQSPVIDKARLFIKPSELVDGIGRLGLEGPRKDKDKDVISKAILTKRGNALSCLRCRGHTEIKAATSSGHASMRWFGWEKTWVKRCICGGSWISQTVSL